MDWCTTRNWLAAEWMILNNSTGADIESNCFQCSDKQEWRRTGTVAERIAMESVWSLVPEPAPCSHSTHRWWIEDDIEHSSILTGRRRRYTLDERQVSKQRIDRWRWYWLFLARSVFILFLTTTTLMVMTEMRLMKNGRREFRALINTWRIIQNERWADGSSSMQICRLFALTRRNDR